MIQKKMPFLSKNTSLFLIMLLTLCFASLAHAQADRVGNGGSWSEADLKHFLHRLIPYLKSEEGKRIFPEMVAYDQAHPNETIDKIASELNPRLVEHAVFDSVKNERDCVSYKTPPRYFECNLARMPQKPDDASSNDQKSQYYGSLYRLVLHEIFVQAGIEPPLTKELPSSYAISSRLMVHLEDFPEWVPGSSKLKISVQTNVSIRPKPEFAIGLGAGTALNSLHYGVEFKIELPVFIEEQECKVGLSSAFYSGIGNRFSKADSWTIPLFAIFEYEFKTHSTFKPYLGVNIGTALIHETRNGYYGYNTPSVPYSDSSFNFLAGITPGISFGRNDGYFFEVPIFYSVIYVSAIPTLGLHF